MNDAAIILRPAEITDAEAIRQVIHAEGKTWDLERIIANIDSLFVLIYQKRILGVLCGTFTPGKETVSWVSVHPMYPESSLGMAMVQGLRGVLSRRPLHDRGREIRQEFSVGHRFGAFFSHFKVRGVKNGFSGQ